MTTIDRSTDLTAWTGVPVTVTRTVDGVTGTFYGVFTALSHGADNPRPEFRRDEAGGTFTYTDHRGHQSTGLCVPYGSTISHEGVAA